MPPLCGVTNRLQDGGGSGCIGSPARPATHPATSEHQFDFVLGSILRMRNCSFVRLVQEYPPQHRCLSRKRHTLDVTATRTLRGSSALSRTGCTQRSWARRGADPCCRGRDEGPTRIKEHKHRPDLMLSAMVKSDERRGNCRVLCTADRAGTAHRFILSFPHPSSNSTFCGSNYQPPNLPVR